MTDTFDAVAADLDDAGQHDMAERVRKLTGDQATTWRGDENR